MDLVVAPLTTVDTAISATTATLGEFDVYRATATSITITISSADITDGREFTFKGVNAGISVGTPVTIATEGGELIDGAASIVLTASYASVTLDAFNGNLESRVSTTGNASDRVTATRDPSLTRDVFSPSGFGVPVIAPDGEMRVLLIEGCTYVIHGPMDLPRMWVPAASVPGTTSAVTLRGASLVTLSVDGGLKPHIWGRSVGSLVVTFLEFLDTSNGGLGRGSVLFDLEGGNGPLSFLDVFECAIINFKRIANIVDLYIAISGKLSFVGNESGFVARFTPAGIGGTHYLALSQIVASLSSITPFVTFIGVTEATTVLGNGIDLTSPSSFIHIDSGSATGSYTISSQNYRGVALSGEFFRPDLVATVTEQTDASVTITSFDDSVDDPGVATRVNFGAIQDLVRGQVILIADEAAYDGVHTIIRVAADMMSVDIPVVHSTSGPGTLAMTTHAVGSNGYVRDETVVLSETTNYNGTHQIIRETETSFTLPQSFDGDDATGTATSTGRDQTSPGVLALGNGAQADSQAITEICWNANAAATTVLDGTPGPMELTGVMQTKGERIFLNDPATGEATYIGERPTSLTVRVNIGASTAPAGLRTYRVKVSINQVVTSPAYSTLEVRAEVEQVVYQTIVDVVKGDAIRVEIEGEGTTDSPTIIEGQVIIST